jgi:phage terminase large subunit GpA-like protein
LIWHDHAIASLPNTEGLLGQVLALATPPERIALSDWADAHRVLSSEASAAPGPWRTLPFQRLFLPG